MLVCSFTRAAAAEIATPKGKAPLPIRDEQIGTLHSFAFRAAGHTEIAETAKHLREFSDAYPQYAVTSAKSAADLEDLGGEFSDDAQGDRLLADYSRLRNLMAPRPTWPAEVTRFAEVWEEFKRETDSIDFTDMLTIALRDSECAPGNPTVLIVDECFPGTAEVALADGTEVPIKKIVEERWQCAVVARDMETGELRERRVIGWHKVPRKGRRLLSSNGLTATEDHPVYVRECGHSPVQWGKVLSCAAPLHALYLHHKKLRRRRTHGTRTVDHRWVATWRRIGAQEPGAGRQCADSVQTRGSASGIDAPPEEGFVYCIDVEVDHNFFADRILVHNCQDLSRLQAALVWQWAKSAEKIVFGGDSDQALYTWSGVDPRIWVEVKPKHLKVLAQSYRVPAAVHALARGWIRRLNDREDYEYHPRLDGDGRPAPGLVRQEPYRWDRPQPLIEDAERQVAAGRSVMILATCGYMLGPTVDALRAAAIPFANPWRSKRADWNPLAARGDTSTVRALRDFLTPHRFGDRFWTRHEVDNWFPALSRVFRRSSAETLSTVPNDIDDQTLYDLLRSLAKDGPGFVEGTMSAPPDCIDWFQQHLKSARRGAGEFPCAVARRRGIEAIVSSPRLWVGTIHSFKGGEADVCYLFPDMSRKGLVGFLSDPGPTIRQFYVGFTRAREELVLCSGTSGNRVKWPEVNE